MFSTILQSVQQRIADAARRSGRREDEDDHSLKIVPDAARVSWVLDLLEGIGKGLQERNLSVGVEIHGKTSVFYAL